MFRWYEASEKIFKYLKKRFTDTRVLTLLEGTKGFLVYCDASYVRLNCVLMRNRKVIAYASWEIKFHEKNYPNHDWKFVVVLFVLNIWRDF